MATKQSFRIFNKDSSFYDEEVHSNLPFNEKGEWDDEVLFETVYGKKVDCIDEGEYYDYYYEIDEDVMEESIKNFIVDSKNKKNIRDYLLNRVMYKKRFNQIAPFAPNHDDIFNMKGW